MKHLISEDQKLIELMVTMKETKSEHSSPAKTKAISIKLPKLSIPKFDGDVLNWITIGSSSRSQYITGTSCQMLRR